MGVLGCAGREGENRARRFVPPFYQIPLYVRLASGSQHTHVIAFVAQPINCSLLLLNLAEHAKSLQVASQPSRLCRYSISLARKQDCFVELCKMRNWRSSTRPPGRILSVIVPRLSLTPFLGAWAASSETLSILHRIIVIQH